ncbi:hypothetical protein HAX54_051284 [Datura stramonium]|uniref:Cytochrome P450 n=1 Tax=Datura stramonium TaxID=4076 RepID=A0ABS8SY37_DATST|nr:hypothetical protein [Datura stramonium]
MKRRLMNNLKDLRAVCEEIIQEHVERRDEKGDASDFVDVLLSVQKRDDLQVPITHDNLKALILDIFIALTDTSKANTLEWTMTSLARHPSVLERAQDEVRKIVSNRGKKDIDFKGQDFRFLPFGGGRRGCPKLCPWISDLNSHWLVCCTLNGNCLPGVATQDVDLSRIFDRVIEKSCSKACPTINNLYMSGEK